MSRNLYPTLSVTNNRDFELNLTHAANQAFGRLVGEVKIEFDREKRRLSYSSMLVSQSRTPGGPSMAAGVALTSQSPAPVLRFEFGYSSVEGSIDQFLFVGSDVTVTVDAHPRIATEGEDANKQRPQRTREVHPVIVIVAGVAVVGVMIAAFIGGSAALAAAGTVMAAVALLALLREMADLGGAGTDKLPRAALPALVSLRVQASTRTT